MLTKKPKKTEDDFINSAKIAEKKMSSHKLFKNYLLQLPYDIWASAKGCAATEGLPLYQYIINAITEKNNSLKER